MSKAPTTVSPTAAAAPTADKPATSADLTRLVRIAADSVLTIAARRRIATAAIAATVAARVGGMNATAADADAAAALSDVSLAADRCAASIGRVADCRARLTSTDAAAAGLDPSVSGRAIAALLTASVAGTSKAGKSVIATFATR
jgi:hypothetical protein